MFTRASNFATTLLAALSCLPAHAQTPDAWVDFEWRSSLDGDRANNHAAMLDEARRDVLNRFAPAWLQQAVGADARRAREQALEQARQSPATFVSLDIRHGPTGRRLGANGYLAGRARVNWTAIDSIYQTKLAPSRRAPRQKVMVLISEYDGPHRFDPSKSATAIESALVAGGNTVVNEAQLNQLREQKLDYAKLDQKDQEIIARIVHDQGVQILITGTVRIVDAQRAPIGGGHFANLYTADCTVTAVWANTAKVIFGYAGPIGRRTFPSPELAIEGVAADLADACRRHLAVAVPPDEIEIVIDGLDSPAFEHEIRTWIEEITGPGAIRSDTLSGPRLSLTVQTTLSTYEAARQLSERAKQSAAKFALRQTERALGTVEFVVELR